MTIKDVLKRDYTVCQIEVNVYVGSCLHTVYLVGRKVKPSRYARFQCETQAGDVYNDGNIRHVLIRRNIQACHREQMPSNQIGCVGVLTDQIPKALLDLEIEQMRPSSVGIYETGPDMHMYTFWCERLLAWGGVEGEDVIVESEEEASE